MKKKKVSGWNSSCPCLQHAKSLHEAITAARKIDMFKLRETLFIRKSILRILSDEYRENMKMLEKCLQKISFDDIQVSALN